MIANFIYNWHDFGRRCVAKKFGNFTVNGSASFIWLLFFGILFDVWIGRTVRMSQWCVLLETGKCYETIETWQRTLAWRTRYRLTTITAAWTWLTIHWLTAYAARFGNKTKYWLTEHTASLVETIVGCHFGHRQLWCVQFAQARQLIELMPSPRE